MGERALSFEEALAALAGRGAQISTIEQPAQMARCTCYPGPYPTTCLGMCWHVEPEQGGEVSGRETRAEPHRYTTHTILYGGEPAPCVICGGQRQDALHMAAQEDERP
jgi:hypothetical protein